MAAKLEVRALTKTYPRGGEPLTVLAGVNLDLVAGDNAAIVGPSGSGKSTLLHILGGLDHPSGGTVRLADQDPFAGTERERARFRNRRVGFVFQDHHLLPQATVLENVLVPLLAAGPVGAAEEQWAEELLARVGLSERRGHRPAQLSGGERQRAALARALVTRPALLLCDEPTGNLDRRSARVVADLIIELQRATESILVIVTHSAELAARMNRRFELDDGVLREIP